MTATECAGILHLTPKTCSYHLQTLASSGLIEEVSTPGRNRPWQLVAGARGPQPAVASRARTAVRLRREESLLDDAAEGVAAAPAEWTEAVTVHTRVATMTAGELQAWCDEVERVTTRHVRRSSVPDVTERLGVQLLFCGFPTPQ